MTRNPTNFGTNVATLSHASVSPCWTSMATIAVPPLALAFALWSRCTPPHTEAIGLPVVPPDTSNEAAPHTDDGGRRTTGKPPSPVAPRGPPLQLVRCALLRGRLV